MNKLMVSLAVAGVFFLSLATGAQAAGAGGYLELTSGSGEFEYETSPDFDVDSDSVGFGFVFDTDLADKRVFNYRLNVGFEALDLEDEDDDTLELEGLVIDNTFGFAIVRERDFRWWAGPQLSLGFYSGETDNGIMTADLAAIGVGGITGVNFLSGNFCTSISVGFRYMGYAGEAEYFGYKEDLEGNTSIIFINAAILFGR